MADEKLPTELVAFLNRCVESIGQLEALLLLHAQPTTRFTAQKMAEALRSDAVATAKWLECFHKLGLVQSVEGASPPTYVFCPGDPNEALVGTLAKEYKQYPHRVIGVILDKLNRQMMSFMSAFRIGKDGKGDGG